MADRFGRRWWLLAVLAAALAVAAVACSADEPSSGVPDGGRQSTTGSVGANPAPGEATQDGAAESPDKYSAGPSGQSLPPLLGLKVIRTASINVRLEDVSKGFEEVVNIAQGAGGFVASSSFGHEDDRTTASITIRVPSERYEDTLLAVRKIGEVDQEQSTANDVTEEYTDLQSRLRNLQSIEERYTELLARAESIDEILIVQDRLNATRNEIEQVQGRINLLSNQTSLATITVHLSPPPVEPAPVDDGASGPLEVAAEAFQASLAVLLGIATASLAVLAFSWWLVPLLLVGAYAARRQWRSLRT